MFISEAKTFHDAIKPLVYFNWFFGIDTLRQVNQSDTVQFFSHLYTVLVTLANWTILYFNLTLIPDVIKVHNSTHMRLLVYKALVYTNSCIAVITPFLLWLKRKEIRDCLRRMLILDDTFQAILGAQMRYGREYIRMSCQIIFIFLIICIISISNSVFSLEIKLEMDAGSVWKFFGITYTLHRPILILLLLDLNFCAFVGYLGDKFRDLNNSLLELTMTSSTFRLRNRRLFIIPKNLINTRPGNGVKNAKAEEVINEKLWLLREVRKSHLELCRLSRKINIIFGLQNLLSSAISFAMITGMLYTICSVVSGMSSSSYKIEILVVSSLWTAIYGSKIWKVNHSCWKVSNEADRTGEVIYELLNSRVDKELNTEINGFAIQMLKNPIRFDACGFFTLDYTLVQGMIGSITTYLVILIQMSGVSETPSSNSPLNDTKT